MFFDFFRKGKLYGFRENPFKKGFSDIKEFRFRKKVRKTEPNQFESRHPLHVIGFMKKYSGKTVMIV